MDARLQKYAKLAVRKGVNLQKGQTLIINTSVEALEMTRACVEEAYQAGAKEVLVFYKDDYVSKQHYQYQDEETLCTVCLLYTSYSACDGYQFHITEKK